MRQLTADDVKGTIIHFYQDQLGNIMAKDKKKSKEVKTANGVRVNETVEYQLIVETVKGAVIIIFKDRALMHEYVMENLKAHLAANDSWPAYVIRTIIRYERVKIGDGSV